MSPRGDSQTDPYRNKQLVAAYLKQAALKL
ncbi:hypothetical protein Pla22_44380 [Rubripirellula amarantea]|uniref:Uncharacterized protein n=1 Tax=Rubripirellula amarantea TaxID=2527999 RepID=A0A5C5WE48_9BACT|nr:hypothetical protein Pla22_44380 [Rubripirellula amarantea]